MTASHLMPTEGAAWRHSRVFSEEMFIMTSLRPHSGLVAKVGHRSGSPMASPGLRGTSGGPEHSKGSASAAPGSGTPANGVEPH